MLAVGVEARTLCPSRNLISKIASGYIRTIRTVLTVLLELYKDEISHAASGSLYYI